MYAAVVFTKSGRPSKRGDGSFACFTDEVKEEAISTALQMRDLWQKAGSGPYRILVGELTEEVTVPMQYELRPVAKPQRSLKPAVQYEDDGSDDFEEGDPDGDAAADATEYQSPTSRYGKKAAL